jgi:hypothetical protein
MTTRGVRRTRNLPDEAPRNYKRGVGTSGDERAGQDVDRTSGRGQDVERGPKSPEVDRRCPNIRAAQRANSGLDVVGDGRVDLYAGFCRLLCPADGRFPTEEFGMFDAPPGARRTSQTAVGQQEPAEVVIEHRVALSCR